MEKIFLVLIFLVSPDNIIMSLFKHVCSNVYVSSVPALESSELSLMNCNLLFYLILTTP